MSGWLQISFISEGNKTGLAKFVHFYDKLLAYHYPPLIYMHSNLNHILIGPWEMQI